VELEEPCSTIMELEELFSTVMVFERPFSQLLWSLKNYFSTIMELEELFSTIVVFDESSILAIHNILLTLEHHSSLAND
jgi:hypothetical protein